MTNRILFGVLIVVLVLVNYSIIRKELVLANGQTMLLRLAPRDPRSIIQGDYMALRYGLARQIGGNSTQTTADGYVIVSLDEKGVATYLRQYRDREPLQPGEHLLQYRIRNGRAKIATDAFFFQERHGNDYRGARYGEIKVSDGGEAVLVGLRDGNYQVLKPDDSSMPSSP